MKGGFQRVWAMQKRVEFVNTLRGLAAVLVVISHYYGAFWFSHSGVADLIKRPQIPSDGAPFYVNWLQIHPYFNWGTFGVALFFLISGFVIANSLTKTPAMIFLKNRIIRIVPVYAVGFAISLAAIYYNVHQLGQPMPFPTSHILVHFFPGIRDILGTTNIDAIVWTLEIEMKFYVICAMAAALFRRRSTLVFAIPIAIAAMLVIVSLVMTFDFFTFAGRMVHTARYIIFMFAGVSLYYGYSGALSKWKAFIVSVGMLLLFLLAWSVKPMFFPFPFACNFVLAFVLFCVALEFESLFRATRVTNFLASISYPLYVVHCIAGYTLLSVLRENGVRSSIALAITTAAATGVAYLIHVLIEKPIQQRNWPLFFGWARASTQP